MGQKRASSRRGVGSAGCVLMDCVRDSRRHVADSRRHVAARRGFCRNGLTGWKSAQSKPMRRFG
eukprot:749509-Pleurochrysis_carterae.AAC.1